ncbi:uncharacterized protein LOC141889472 [Acropora palmata]|uniref:uncharacterized protein LOC141889472 n=1 Tax=Acropora palmata TaxID=6131 RepID=UPI003DA092FC
MAGGEEFLFDAVIGFLTSPIWNHPVRTFIEQNSLVFDPDGANHDEYKKIHSTYKSMVETLLSSFLKDVGITEEQFMKACKDGSGSPQFSTISRDVFDQIWAADDFEVFKQLMIQKNIELQLQALQIFQQIHNAQMPMPMPMQMPVAIPTSHSTSPATGAPSAAAAQLEEDAIMREVLRKSKEEYEAQRKSAEEKVDKELEKTLAESQEESNRLMEIAKKEQEELEKALKSSLDAQEKQTAEAEKLSAEVKQSTVQPPSKASAVESKQAAKTAPPESKPSPKPSTVKSKSSTQDTKASEKSKLTEIPPLPGQPKKPSNAASDAAAGWIQSAKNEAAGDSTVKQATQAKEISPEEMKKRAEYLKQQRDKLLALKKREREKSLTKYTEQQPKARPTTAKAAHRVTSGEQVEPLASESSEQDAKKLAMRRALADVLKREVIDK